MPENFFQKRKKKKLIDDINNFRANYHLSKLDLNIIDKYSYQTMRQLLPTDHTLIEDQLIFLLNSIEIVGERLKNIRYIRLFSKDVNDYLKTKEDYINYDKICSKFDDFIISDYLDNNVVNSMVEVTLEKITKYIEDKEAYKLEHDKERIKQYLSENDVEYDSNIKTYTDAITYVKILEFINKNNTFPNIDEPIKKIPYEENDFTIFKKLKNLFAKTDIDMLTEEQKFKLNEYLNFLSYNFDIFRDSIQIDNVEELDNYEQLKQECCDKNFLNDNKEALFYMLFSPLDAMKRADNIIDKCNNLNEIFLMDKNILEKELGFTNLELDTIKFLANIQKINNSEELFELYKYYRNNGINFRNIDLSKLKNKIRTIYGYEISKSLTKLSNMSEISFLGNDKYGVPLYQKETGSFKFLTHTISNKFVLNTTIQQKIGNKNFYRNPELWDEFPREFGTVALSTSYISETETPYPQWNNSIIYGFDELEPTDVRNISPEDGGTSHKTQNIDTYGGADESMYFSQTLLEKSIKNSSYNEIAFKRYNPDGTRKKPNFILCFNQITEASVEHAKYHQVPILLIKTEKYIKDIADRIVSVKNIINESNKTNLIEYKKNLEQLIYLLRCFQMFPGSPCFNSAFNMKYEAEEELKRVNQLLEQQNQIGTLETAFSSPSRAFINSNFWIVIITSIILFIIIWLIYIKSIT